MKRASAARAGRLLLVLLAAAGLGMALRNAYFLSRDVVLGDKSGLSVVPRPAFGFERIHNTAQAREYEAVGRLAIDFAQIYFPSRPFSSLVENYETGALDPSGRASLYAPFIHYACAISICKLDYGPASFAHLVVQLLLFYGSLTAGFLVLGVRRHLWVGLLVTTLFLFLTPAGLGWFERGQFSLYVGASYLLLIVGLLKQRLWLVVLSAVFAYVKWTSLPFVFVVLSLYMLSSRSVREAIQKAVPALLYFLVWMVLSLPFTRELSPFLKGLYVQEGFEFTMGLSLTKVLPAGLVKVIPFLLVLVGYVYLRRNGGVFERLLPYLIGSGVLLVTYPQVVFEYNLPILLAFIPLVFYWTREAGRTNELIRYAYLVFLVSIGLAYFLFYAGVDAGLIMLGECVVVFLASLFHPLLVREESAAPA